jgi:pseudaminic acid synthase
MNNYITIDQRKIGLGFPPYIIAEMSANHNSDINNAFKIIDMAKNSGAEAIKIQTYTPDTLTIDSSLPDFQITDGLWAGESLYSLYKKAFTPWEWHGPLFDYAKKQGITIFSSPFDNSAVDLLEDLNVQAYKIASFEAVDLPLIKYVAQTGKPIIISTGMADKEEIKEAIEEAKSAGSKEIAVLHCISSYPAPSNEYNLKTMVDLQKEFGIVTGLSDHTIDNVTAIASVALGSSIVEKHVTLNRKGGGADDSFSLEANELESLCIDSLKAWQSLGEINYERKASESKNIKFRRSLYFIKDIEAGELITKENIRSIRPGFGLKPKFLEKILGKRAKYKIKAGTSSSWELIE